MRRCCVFMLLIHLIMACNLEDPENYNEGLVCLLKWIHKVRGDLEGEKSSFRQNTNSEAESNIKRDNKLNRNFLRFGRSNFIQNNDLQERWLDSGNPKLMSRSRSARLIRELARKRGSLEKNFLRFGRNLDNINNVTMKRSERQTDPKRNTLEKNFLRFGRMNVENNDNEGYSNLKKSSSLDRNFLRFGRPVTTTTLLKNKWNHY